MRVAEPGSETRDAWQRALTSTFKPQQARRSRFGDATALGRRHARGGLGAGAPHFERPLLLAASNANIGGPATAAALVEGPNL